MVSEYYISARKMGLRAYNQALAQNRSPYLPSLDEQVEGLNSLAKIPLGIIKIPIERIKGTLTGGRSAAFACNFMPLLEVNTEFSEKWSQLYRSVSENGVRQPVTAVEYMGYYYLVEGNKRVSVMKCLDAVYIEGDVTRYMPRRTNELANIVYYESLDFQADSGIYEIYLTEPGYYARLTELTGHKKGEKWDKDSALDLRSAYMYFANAYKSVITSSLAMNCADAFVVYLIAFGYDKVKVKTNSELKADLRLMRSEFERGSDNDNVSLMLDREELPAQSLFSHLFRPSKIKAAFLYTRPPEESGWNYWHELGRLNAGEGLDTQLETSAHIISSRTEFEDAIENLIKDGNRVIFATSPVMLNSCIRPSLEHPDVKLLCCSNLSAYHDVRTYYLRLYEAKFITGLVAGMMTQNNKIGYIADYPIYGTPSAINAFAIGARMANPKAVVKLAWSTCRDFDPDHPFSDESVRIISNRDINAPCHSSNEFGLYSINEDNSNTNLAMPLLDWGKFYQTMIRNVLSGSFDGEIRADSALNYWWGMSSGALDVLLSSRFDVTSARLINHMKDSVRQEILTPFEGTITDQTGKLRCEPDRKLTPAEILCMDYLVDNIEGILPSIDMLTEAARPIVKLQGLHGELRPDISDISWINNELG